MKKSILALLAVSLLSTSAFAGINKGDSVSDDLRFQEKVERVCGVVLGNDEGTIKFNNETGAGEVATEFTVYDNGSHKTGGQTEVSVETKHLSDNLEAYNVPVKYAINNIDDARDSINRAPTWVKQKQKLFATVDADKRDVNTGVAKIVATVTVHCDK